MLCKLTHILKQHEGHISFKHIFIILHNCYEEHIILIYRKNMHILSACLSHPLDPLRTFIIEQYLDTSLLYMYVTILSENIMNVPTISINKLFILLQHDEHISYFSSIIA